jgi:hypothetical protein
MDFYDDPPGDPGLPSSETLESLRAWFAEAQKSLPSTATGLLEIVSDDDLVMAAWYADYARAHLIPPVGDEQSEAEQYADWLSSQRSMG